MNNWEPISEETSPDSWGLLQLAGGPQQLQHSENYHLLWWPYNHSAVSTTDWVCMYGAGQRAIHHGHQERLEVDENITALMLFISTGAAPFHHLEEDGKCGSKLTI